ncbi:hypothetical protein Cni_G17750 [Canna indica]|uniref:MAPK kinase substrate protein n=1 Tax=Canna indica TaxID=4628 RepID=A0AAQ3KI20_9LILI|nr:hypothetical protein Cni_G17750 [Canna indica]
MAELQRSVTTFRRSGSSGLVWDEKLFTEDMKKKEEEEEGGEEEAGAEFRELRHSKSVGSIGMMARSRSIGGGGGSRHAGFRARNLSPPADPQSPEVPRCCGFFSKQRSAKIPKPRTR